jgi:adenylate kinase family enzyme
MSAKKWRLFHAFLKSRSKRRKLSVYLDEEAFTRFERLKRKLRTLDDSQILSLSLKVMEKTTDRTIAVYHMNKKARRNREEAEKLTPKKDFGRQQSSQSR